MKISLNWLTDYVDVSMSADELAELFTRIGLNCDGVAHGVGCRVRSGRDLQSAGLPGPFGRGAELAAVTGAAMRRPAVGKFPVSGKAAELTSVPRGRRICARGTSPA